MAPVSNTGSAPSFLNTLGLARQGIDSGVRAFADVAQAVAADGTHGRVAASNVVGALEARNQVAVSARLFQTADQMLGTLLDIRA
jgi:hypothetical protein